MREHRTTLQADADRLDAEVYRLVTKLDRFADKHRKNEARDMALTIDGLRHRIRQHMHPHDREATFVLGGSDAS